MLMWAWAVELELGCCTGPEVEAFLLLTPQGSIGGPWRGGRTYLCSGAILSVLGFRPNLGVPNGVDLVFPLQLHFTPALSSYSPISSSCHLSPSYSPSSDQQCL
jgi:hypothetical protein